MERIKYELYGIRPRVVNFSGETSKVLNSPEPKPGRLKKMFEILLLGNSICFLNEVNSSNKMNFNDLNRNI
jgi:hypothetical protein